MIIPWDVLDEAAQLWKDVLAQVSGSDLDARSGCTDWTNRDLINHLIGGGDRYAMLLGGASAEESATTRDHDYVIDGWMGEFQRSDNRFRDALATTDLDVTVDHRVARRPGRELIPMRIMELTLHTHDLCVGLGAQWGPSESLASYLLTDAASLVEEFRRFGAVAPARTPQSESPADRILAFAGRG